MFHLGIGNLAVAKEVELNKESISGVSQPTKSVYLPSNSAYTRLFDYASYNNFNEYNTDYLKLNSIDIEASSLVQKATEYAHRGYTRLALISVRRAIKLSENNQNLSLQIQAQGILGNIHFINGDYLKAIAAYEKSLTLAQISDDRLINVVTWNNLANTWNVLERDYKSQSIRVQNDTAEAERLANLSNEAKRASLYAAEKAFESSKEQISISAVRAWINWHHLNGNTEVETSIPLWILEQLPVDRSQVYLLIDLAKLSSSDAVGILQQAVIKAIDLEDDRALSFAFGALGNTYEQQNRITQAIQYTEEAILKAQVSLAVDSLYRWQWQAGRLHKNLGKMDKAKSYYREAIATLQSERSEIIALSKQRRWDFRDQVEPVYRELIELLLANNQTQEIQEALNIFELLSLSELKNFFEDDCVEITNLVKNNLKQSRQQTNSAIISSVILSKQTYIILQLPDNKLKVHRIEINREELSVQIREWHELLTNVATNRYLGLSQSLYDLLIRPIEKDLAEARVNTIVLIQDGILRNVPLAALHDGQNFLIEKYPIANVLGLNLITDRRVNNQRESKVLAFGLSKAVDEFASLPNVLKEINNINQIFETKTKLNEEFTLKEFQKQVQQKYSLVHLATHGKFNGSLNNSFITAFDGRISLQQLESMLSSRKEPLELLVLSACDTSVGDDRSVLGLAGVLVRSGTRAAIGSLWSVNDATTAEFMTDFYQNLVKNNMDKTSALRQAQLSQIANPLGHPATWSAFILIGNWQ